MEILRDTLMYLVAFGAMIVMVSSLIGVAFWLLREAWRVVARSMGPR